nr:Unknown Function [uncultured bacterium]
MNRRNFVIGSTALVGIGGFGTFAATRHDRTAKADETPDPSTLDPETIDDGVIVEYTTGWVTDLFTQMRIFAFVTRVYDSEDTAKNGYDILSLFESQYKEENPNHAISESKEIDVSKLGDHCAGGSFFVDEPDTEDHPLHGTITYVRAIKGNVVHLWAAIKERGDMTEELLDFAHDHMKFDLDDTSNESVKALQPTQDDLEGFININYELNRSDD